LQVEDAGRFFAAPGRPRGGSCAKRGQMLECELRAHLRGGSDMRRRFFAPRLVLLIPAGLFALAFLVWLGVYVRARWAISRELARISAKGEPSCDTKPERQHTSGSSARNQHTTCTTTCMMPSSSMRPELEPYQTRILLREVLSDTGNLARLRNQRHGGRGTLKEYSKRSWRKGKGRIREPSPSLVWQH